MIRIRKIDDIYPAIGELIAILNKNDKQRQLAAILQHRIYKVSWTSRSELFEELNKVLKGFIEKDKHSLEEPFLNQVNEILKIIGAKKN
jgi:hypothetical protein